MYFASNLFVMVLSWFGARLRCASGWLGLLVQKFVEHCFARSCAAVALCYTASIGAVSMVKKQITARVVKEAEPIPNMACASLSV